MELTPLRQQGPSTARFDVSREAPARGARLVNRPVGVLLGVLLFVSFLTGPLKLLRIGWLPYILPDALTLTILAFVFIDRGLSGRPLFARGGLTLPILVLASLCIIELMNPAAPFMRSVLGLRTWILYLGFYFVGAYTLRSPRQIVHLYGLLLVLGSLTALYGLYQWHQGPQTFASWSDVYGQYAKTMWAAGHFRAFSTFVLPNTFGANMGLLMLIAFSVVASRAVRVGWRVAAGCAFAIMGGGIAASGTRTPVVELALAALMGVLFLRPESRHFRLVLTWVALSLAATFTVITTIGTGVGERFVSILDPSQYFWKWFYPFVNGISLALTHPFGMGIGYSGGVPHFLPSPTMRDLPTTVIDSGYGAAAAEMGLVGLGVFAYFLLKTAVEAVRAWRNLAVGEVQDLLLAPALIAVTYPVLALIGGIHASLPSSVYTWLLIGMLIKSPALQKEPDADRVPAPGLHAR